MVNNQFPTILCICLYCSVILAKRCLGSDTLYPNQTIVVGQTLISQNQVFVMGFFAVGASRNKYYLGTWYKNTPDVVVWVANRNDPIMDPRGVVLTIASNGTFLVSTTSGNRFMWSSNSSVVASHPILKLLDTGNLVIVENTSQSSSSSDSYLWQSFDYPGNTRLPGMKLAEDMNLTSWRSYDDPSPGDFVYKIDNHGLSELSIFRGKSKTYRTGPWNGVYLGTPKHPRGIPFPELVFDEGRLVSTIVPYDSSSITRVTIEYSGVINVWSMNERRDRWNAVRTLPRDQCDNYGLCGPNGICSMEAVSMCKCFKGFSPKFPSAWDSVQYWSDGCVRNRPPNCHGGDGFQEIRGVKIPDLLQFRLNTSMSLRECRDECLKNCNCTGYANPFINDGGSGCLMWFGDLIDTREELGTDTNQSIYIRVPNSELDSGTESMKMEKKGPQKLVTIIVTPAGVIIVGLISGLILLRIRRKTTKAARRNNEDLDLPLFKFATIAAATNNFARENMIGEGGFGPVYRGNLSAEEEIAVKRLSRTSRQGPEEFKTEVSLIAKLQHRNLVRLLGCCIEGEERMLVYEFLQNKSLDYFVFDEKRRTLLTWPTRFEIIIGISRGLLYLHHDSRLKIIHRDLKTSNILLDGDLRPKISDFGLARISSVNETIASTKRVVGTYGYMAPEYAFDGKYSLKSDIYSLGVVFLEMVSGKKNRGFVYDDHHHCLLGHAWLLWKANKVMELMDECLNDTFIESQVRRCIQVGLLCVQKFAQDRPLMPSVLSMLGTDGAILPEPKQPGFFSERSSECYDRSCSQMKVSGAETITMTELVAR